MNRLLGSPQARTKEIDFELDIHVIKRHMSRASALNYVTTRTRRAVAAAGAQERHEAFNKIRRQRPFTRHAIIHLNLYDITITAMDCSQVQAHWSGFCIAQLIWLARGPKILNCDKMQPQRHSSRATADQVPSMRMQMNILQWQRRYSFVTSRGCR